MIGEQPLAGFVRLLRLGGIAVFNGALGDLEQQRRLAALHRIAGDEAAVGAVGHAVGNAGEQPGADAFGRGLRRGGGGEGQSEGQGEGEGGEKAHAGMLTAGGVRLHGLAVARS